MPAGCLYPPPTPLKFPSACSAQGSTSSSTSPPRWPPSPSTACGLCSRQRCVAGSVDRFVTLSRAALLRSKVNLRCMAHLHGQPALHTCSPSTAGPVPGGRGRGALHLRVGLRLPHRGGRVQGEVGGPRCHVVVCGKYGRASDALSGEPPSWQIRVVLRPFSGCYTVTPVLCSTGTCIGCERHCRMCRSWRSLPPPHPR